MTRRRVALLVALALSAPACATEGLAFVQDDRLEFTSPDENAEVPVPLRLEWAVEDFDGFFALFFDRSPMRPGQDLRSLVSANDPCHRQAVCPDAEWLAQHGVYVTDAHQIDIPQLPDRRDSNRSEDRHEVVIVLLDPSGVRLGESVFHRELIIDRED